MTVVTTGAALKALHAALAAWLLRRSRYGLGREEEREFRELLERLMEIADALESET